MEKESKRERVQKNQLEQRDRAKTKTVKQVQKSITNNRLRAKGERESFALRCYVHMYYVLTYDRVCVHKARAAPHSVPRYGGNASKHSDDANT